MRNQLQRHFVITLWAKQRVFAKAVEEALLKRLGRQHSVASGVGGYVGRDNLGKLFSDLLVSHIAVQSVITDSVKSLWQDVLDHPSHKLPCRESFMLDLSCFVIPIPITDRVAIILFNPANRDRRRNNILCQVLGQPLSAGWYFSGLQKSHKAFGIISPCQVDVFFNGRIGNIFSEHFQEMILPFFVHDFVGDIRNRLPLAVFVKSPGSHEDMKMGVIMAGSSGGLQDDNISDIELAAATGIENIFETPISCLHEGVEQFGITIKPGSQELRHGQDHMAVSDTRKETPSDEVGPLVNIDLGTREAKAGFAGEGNAAYFSTVAASVLNKAHLFGIAAVEHFLDSVVVVGTVKAWPKLFKRIPMIVENLFKCVFVNAFHGSLPQTTITGLTQKSRKNCYIRGFKVPGAARLSSSYRNLYL